MLKPDVEIKVMVTRPMAEGLRRLASRHDLTEGAIVREALRRLLEAEAQQSSGETPQRRYSAASHTRSNIEHVRTLVANAVKASSDWKDLNHRLSDEGLELAPKGGGLVVRSLSSQEDICKASEIGFPYSKLIRRFRSGFPGHAHEWLADRILGGADELIED